MNILDSKLTKQQKEITCRILDTLQLDNFKVTLKDQVLHFIQDRRVVHVPLSLILKESWAIFDFFLDLFCNLIHLYWNHEDFTYPF